MMITDFLYKITMERSLPANKKTICIVINLSALGSASLLEQQLK